MIETGPQERKQKLLETDHLTAQSEDPISDESGASFSLAFGWITRMRTTDGPREQRPGIWGTLSSSTRGNRDSDLTSWGVPGGSFHPVDKAGGRLAFSRAGAAPTASAVSIAHPACSQTLRGDRTQRAPLPLQLVSHLETT
jgi:hypothetical protein